MDITSDSKSATELAYEHVRRGILGGLHASGEMLSESVLAAELGLSRTPVRAALARLRDEGWLRIYPKRGALVGTLSEREVADLAEAKALLETGAIRATGPEELLSLAQRLEGELETQLATLRAGDLADFVELSIAFHREFAAAPGNGVVLELYDRLADRQRFLLFSYGQRLLDRAGEIVSEHRAMLEALGHGDADRFGDLLRAHLADAYGTGPTITSESLREAFPEQG